MAKTSYRPPLPGPAFIRLLAGLADGKVPSTSPDLSDRLSQWVDWNRAVALSRALDGRLPPPVAESAAFADEDAAEVARVRAGLVEAIGQPLPAAAANAASDDFAPVRQRVLTLQRSMQAATGRLRGKLRDMLGHTGPELARLAEVDAVMEQTLSPREHALLATVPVVLGQHFVRLHAAALPPPPDAAGQAPTAPASDGWRLRFQHDMQRVLLAELDVRFHPIEGLLAVLRPR